MKLFINHKYYSMNGVYLGKKRFWLESKHLGIKWFTDCGDWFLYIKIRGRYYRFSNQGNLRIK